MSNKLERAGEYRIVPMDSDSYTFVGTLYDAIEEAKDRDADVMLDGECLWINPDVQPEMH